MTPITGSEAMAAPRAPPLRLCLFPRSQAGDFVNVGAVDADVLQFAIGIGRKLLQYAPIDAAGAQESGEHLHGGVLLVDRPPDLGSTFEPEEIAPSPRPRLGRLLRCKSQWCAAQLSVRIACSCATEGVKQGGLGT